MSHRAGKPSRQSLWDRLVSENQLTFASLMPGALEAKALFPRLDYMVRLPMTSVEASA